MFSEREVFQKAFALVSNPETWCQRTMARDAEGCRVSPESHKARRWCSVGALYAAIGDDESNLIDNGVYQALYRKLNKTEPAYFNDNHTHEEVVALWTKVGQENGWLP